MTWAAHEEAANAWGGHLASIYSDDENKFIGNGAKKMTDTWVNIGGRRKKGQLTGSGADTWEWSDRKNFDYSTWLPNNPSNEKNKENFISFYVEGNLVGLRHICRIYITNFKTKNWLIQNCDLVLTNLKRYSQTAQTILVVDRHV